MSWRAAVGGEAIPQTVGDGRAGGLRPPRGDMKKGNCVTLVICVCFNTFKKATIEL